MKLIFYDNNNIIIKTVRITDLPIIEEVMVAKSIETYGDPAPCIIRRSAIANVLYSQLADFLQSNLYADHVNLSIDNIPQDLFGCFYFNKEICFLALLK